jgi:hypothetical protein
MARLVTLKGVVNNVLGPLRPLRLAPVALGSRREAVLDRRPFAGLVAWGSQALYLGLISEFVVYPAGGLFERSSLHRFGEAPDFEVLLVGETPEVALTGKVIEVDATAQVGMLLADLRSTADSIADA